MVQRHVGETKPHAFPLPLQLLSRRPEPLPAPTCSVFANIEHTLSSLAMI